MTCEHCGCSVMLRDTDGDLRCPVCGRGLAPAREPSDEERAPQGRGVGSRPARIAGMRL